MAQKLPTHDEFNIFFRKLLMKTYYITVKLNCKKSSADNFDPNNTCQF